MASMDADRNVAFTHYFKASCPPLTLPLYRSASGNSYTSNKHSKMVGNSASYPVYSRNSQLS